MDTACRVSPLDPDDVARLGPYRLAGRLGSGGMGVVYLALDPDDRYVAVKLVHARLAGDPEFRGRFRSEVERARQVPAFCTAEVLDADLDHNPPYLVVEFVDAPSLAEEVDERGPLSTASLRSVAVGVATALTGIHSAGVIHRDLKPENVLLAPGRPKVIDFGIARAFEGTTEHTRTDQMVGTVAYMAPERFSSEPGTPLTPAADVFAWGCVIAYAGIGRTPFHGDSPASTAARILTQPPRLDGLDEPLRSVVRMTLAKAPGDRPTAHELLNMLVDEPPEFSAAPVSAWPRSPTRFAAQEPAFVGAGHRWSSRLLAVLAILLVIGGLSTLFGVLRSAGPTAGNLVADASNGGVAAGAPAASGAASPPATPAKRPATPKLTPKLPSSKPPASASPEGPRLLIQDSLSRPGRWLNSRSREENAECVVNNVLRATRIDRGTFQCTGPRNVVEDDFSVAVTTTLVVRGSCAGVWFHWDDDDGGQVLRVCQEGFTLAQDTPGDQRAVGALSLGRPIPLRQAVRVALVVDGGVLGVFLSGDLVGRIPLPPDSSNGGQVRLGISVQSIGVLPPHTVTFAGVDIRAR